MAEDEKKDNLTAEETKPEVNASADAPASDAAASNGSEAADAGETSQKKAPKEKKKKKSEEVSEEQQKIARGLISHFKADIVFRRKVITGVALFFFISLLIIGLCIVLAEEIAKDEIQYSEQGDVITVTAISINSGLVDTYLADESIDLTRVRLRVTYSDGSNQFIYVTPSMIESPAVDAEGIFKARLTLPSEDSHKYMVTFVYMGCRCQKEINVVRQY